MEPISLELADGHVQEAGRGRGSSQYSYPLLHVGGALSEAAPDRLWDAAGVAREAQV